MLLVEHVILFETEKQRHKSRYEHLVAKQGRLCITAWVAQKNNSFQNIDTESYKWIIFKQTRRRKQEMVESKH